MDRDNLIELQNTIIEFQGDIISILMALYIRAPNFYIPDELQSIISRNNALLETLNSPKGEKHAGREVGSDGDITISYEHTIRDNRVLLLAFTTEDG